MIDFIGKIASLLASIVSGAASAAGSAAAAGGDTGGLGVDSGAGLMAGGGRVWATGPSGTDTVPAWLTPGEFVVRAQAVRAYGSDLFHALNSMSLPFSGFNLGGMVEAMGRALAPTPLMLAAGGPAIAPAAGRDIGTVNLSFGGRTFGLKVQPGEAFDALSRHARSAAIRSAGRKPSWYT